MSVRSKQDTTVGQSQTVKCRHRGKTARIGNPAGPLRRQRESGVIRASISGDVGNK